MRPITFTGTRLRFLDETSKQGSLSGFEFQVLYVISSAADRETGLAIRSLEALADAVGSKDVRRMRRTVSKLEALGLVEINRGGGRGRASTYRLKTESLLHGPVASPAIDPEETGVAQPGYDTYRTEETRVGEPGYDASKTRVKNALNPGQKCPKLGSTDPPLLLIPIKSLPPPIMDRLRNALGRQVAEAWFGKATVEAVEGQTITIGLPTRFVRSRINGHYLDHLIDALSHERQGKVLVRLIVQPARSVSAEPQKAADEERAGEPSANHSRQDQRPSTPSPVPKARVRNHANSIVRFLPG